MARPAPVSAGRRPAGGGLRLKRAVAAGVRGRPTAAAALILALLSVLVYAPALVPGHTLSASDFLWSAAPWAAERPADIPFLGSNFELVDSSTQPQPWLEYTRRRLPEFPLWNPFVGGGRPHFANTQSAVLSPFSLPAYLLPFWWSMGLIGVLKVFAAAFGTYLLGRALDLRFAGALLAGIVFAFSLYFLSWVSWPLPNVWALLPWLLLLSDRVLRSPGPLPAAGLATVVALQYFGGHPESNFHLLAATVAFFAFRLVGLRREGALPAVRAPLVAFAAALIGGTALAAALLAPFLELLFRSGDINVRADFAQITLPRHYLLGFALYEYWGRATQVSIENFTQVRALYAGALPLALAAGAIVMRPSFMRVGVAAFGALMLAVVLGVPPLPDLAQQIPIVRTGNHLRLVVVMTLCVALLAGWGLDDLIRGSARRRTWVLAIAGLLLVAPAVVLLARGELSAEPVGEALRIAWGWAWPSPPPDGGAIAAIRMSSLIVWLSFMGLGLVLLAGRISGRLGATAFAVLALALVAGDLFKAGMGITPAIRTADATQPATRGLDFLESRRPNRFVGLERPLGPSPLLPNVSLRWGLYDARAWDPPVEGRYDKLWRRAVQDGGPTDVPTTSARLTAQSLPAFRLLSVTDIAQDPEDPPVRRPSLPLSYDGRDLRVYATPRPLPRVGVVDAQRVVETEDAQLDAVLDPSFDGRRTLITGERLPHLRDRPGPGPAGEARIVSYKPERVVVEASARRPGELVLTDVHYPGWKVSVDGREADLHRVDYLLRGVELEAGSHRVEFRYQPGSWRAGWIISLVALAGLALTVVLGLRRRPSRRQPPGARS